MAQRRTRQPKADNSSLRFPRASYTSSRNQVSKDTQRSIDKAQRRKTNFKRGVVTLLVTVLVLLFTGWALSFSAVEVKISGADAQVGQETDPDQYAQGFNDYLASTMPFQRNKLLLNRSKLEESLKAKFPQIDSVDLDASFISRSTTLNVNLRDPVAIYVGANGEFLVDNTGVAFLSVVDRNALDFPLVTDDAPQSVEINQPAMSSALAEYINRLDNELQEVGLDASEYAIPLSVREVLIRLENTPYVVKTHVDVNPEQVAVSLKETVDWLAGQGIVPTQYIDLRVPFEAAIK